ncbi:hypothetical protein Tco_1222347 [Tanacetum coccineum]
MEEMLYKFIDEGKREQEEMRAFIHEFKTTNELLFKERNNSLRELRFEVQGLLRVINNTPISNLEVKEVTTRGGKTTTQDIQDNDTNIQTKELLLPLKEKDPWSFTIPYDIGQLHINNALADLGASIRLMPYTMYEKLSLGEPKATRMSLELVDSVIDFDSGEPIRCIKYVNTPYPVAQITAEPNKVETEQLYSASANKINEKKPELKNLPQHLEYAYLYGHKSFPIIILSKLSEREKMLLLRVLEKRKEVIAWKMLDIKGISLSYCTYKILIKDDYKPVIQPQRRLNPKDQDVVKSKIVKLLYSC